MKGMEVFSDTVRTESTSTVRSLYGRGEEKQKEERMQGRGGKKMRIFSVGKVKGKSCQME